MHIDPDQRRRDIARITNDLVAREGLAAATFRGIAAERGWSTAAITNYFDDKRELLVHALQELSAEGERRFAEACIEEPNDPIVALLTMIPWCPANVRRWKAYLAYWDAAMRDGDLAELLGRSASAGTQQLYNLLSEKMAPGADVQLACEHLSAAIQGMALQILVGRQPWSLAKVRGMLETVLERVMGEC